MARRSIRHLHARTGVSRSEVEKIELGEDSTGDPAMWIHLVIEGQVHPASEEAKRIGKFMRDVRYDLFDRGVSHRPYFRTREVA